MLQREPCLTLLNIPQLDCIVATRARKNVFGGRIEEHVANFAGVASQTADWRDVRRLLSVRMQRKALWHTPQEDFAIIGARSKQVIIEWIPVGVEDSGSVAAEEGDAIWGPPTLAHGNDSECAASAGFPIDRKVLRVGLDQVRVPGILRDAEAIVALLALGGLSEDVAWAQLGSLSC
jgi:hypothetical protein